MIFCFLASRISDKIFLCDILESNRAEVERFRAGDDGAHSFARYFDFVAALEGTEEDLELRTRNAIKVAEYVNLISQNLEATFFFRAFITATLRVRTAFLGRGTVKPSLRPTSSSLRSSLTSSR